MSQIQTPNSILSHKLSIRLTTRWWWWWWKCATSVPEFQYPIQFCPTNWASDWPQDDDDDENVPLLFQNSNIQFNSVPQIQHLIDHKMMIIMMMMKMCHFFLLPNVFPEFEHPIQFSATNLSKGFSTIELWRKNVPITFLLTIFPNKKWNCHFSRFKHPIQFSAFKLSTGWCRKCVTFYYIYWNPEPSKLKTPLVNVIPISGNNNHLNNSKWLKDFYSLDILQREMIVC